MSNFNKSSVKLLPIIENTNNRVTFYTEFDGEFEIGDKLYIAVNDSGITEYDILDSMVNTGFTNSAIGYDLLDKVGNKIVLDIKYDIFRLSYTSTNLTEDTCFIGRVYIKNSIINRGIINGCLIKDTETEPLSKANIEWKQGILFDTLGIISNIDFNSKSLNSKLILKSIINTKGVVESFYTENNYGKGLSIINLSDNTFNLINCDITAGVFNNCVLEGDQNEISGGEFFNCFLGDTYIVNNGRFENCEFETISCEWNDGNWYNDYTGTTNNPFRPLTWTNGVWEYGRVPTDCTWLNGRFKGGIFEGNSWYDGEFEEGEFINSGWNNGNFNNGVMSASVWNNGNFNGGVMFDTVWNNGTFNDGVIYSTGSHFNWMDGTFNGGVMTDMNWLNGDFNGGIFSGSTWTDGDWYNGKLIASDWITGNWYNGEFEDSTWTDGKFYNGIMKNSKWNNGSVYYGTFLDMNDYPNKCFLNGIFYNGVLNNVFVFKIDLYNGIANNSVFGSGSPASKINWYNGSFNSGIFGVSGGGGDYNWSDGKFYNGTFSGVWENGTFYTGDITTYIKTKYQVGKSFKPYKEFGAYRKHRRRRRYPRKRRY